MIYFKRDNKNKIYFQFNSDESFKEILEFVKELGLTYKKDFNGWFGSSKNLYLVYTGLIDSESIYIDDDILEEIYPKLQIKKVRKKFNPNLLKFPPIKGKVPHENYQLDDLKFFNSLNRGGIFLDMGLGKFQSLKAKIYTPDGYKLMRDISIGDEIINSQGKTSKVEKVYPQGKKVLYEVVFSDGSKTTSGLDHLWSVKTNNDVHRNKPNRVLTLKQIMDIGVKDKFNNSKFWIPIVKPIEFKEKELIIPPYVFGCLIADGCFRHKSSIGYTKGNKDIVNKIKDLSKGMEFTEATVKGQYYFRKSDSIYFKEIKNLDLFMKKSVDKFIPSKYIYNSLSSRIELLQGLLDSDGGYSNKSLQYYTSSKKLANGVIELVNSLGGVATTAIKKNTKYKYKGETRYGHTAYTLTIKLPEEIFPFKCRFKEEFKHHKKYKPIRTFKEINYIGEEECQCIKTSSPDSLYITDNCIVTHNTWIMTNLINQLYYRREISKVLFLSPVSGVLNLKQELLKFSDYFKEDDIYIADAKNREPFKKENKVIIMTYRTFLMLSEDAYKLTKNYKTKVRNNEKFKNDKKKYKKPSQLLNFKSPVLPIGEWINDHRALICLDESHYIANFKAKQSNAIQVHKEFFEYRYLMSGTPADKIEKYYSQIRFLDDNLILESYLNWLGKIANIGNTFSKYAVTSYKDKEVNKFLELIKPYIRRRLSSECLNLPDNIIKKNLIGFNNKQLQIYTLLIENELNVIKEEGFISSKKLVQKFPYIRQALDNPCLLQGKIDEVKNPELAKLVKGFQFKENSKLEVCTELLNQYITNEDRKVVLWDYHPKTIDQLAEYYKKYNPLIIKGGIGNEERDRILDKFRYSKECKLLIGSFLVLDTSITMTECNRQIYFVRDNQFVKFSQSMKRIHRISQLEKVMTHILQLANSLDIRLDQQMEAKLDINNNLLKKKYLTENECYDIFTGGG